MNICGTKPGSKVRILQDCRDGGTAAGQIGVFEGEFPRSVMFVVRKDGDKPVFGGEYAYDWFMSSPFACVPAWEMGKAEPEVPYVFVIDNPRIRLDDGSIIWGDECWWRDEAKGA